jgi:hypothetical protein
VLVSSHIFTYLALPAAISHYIVLHSAAIERPSQLRFDIPREWIPSETYVKAYDLYKKRDKMIKSIRRPGEGTVHYVLSSQSTYKAKSSLIAIYG